MYRHSIALALLLAAPSAHAAMADPLAAGAGYPIITDTDDRPDGPQTVNGRELKPGASCSGVDLSHQDLSGMSLNDADRTGADLDYSRMAGIDFSGSNLTAVSMEAVWANKARLVGTTLVAANLSEAKFYNADLAGATLGNNTNRFTIREGVHMENCTGCPVDW